MKKDTKKIIITILIIVSMFTIFFVPRIFLTKTNDKLPEVKLKKIIKKDNMFALMVETEDNKYEEYQEEGWPGYDYFYKESKCVDNNGTLVENAITYTSKTNTVILETDKTISCTIFFDKKTSLREVCEKYNNINECLIDKNNPNKIMDLNSDSQGGMYRYQGTDNVSNWICFGTKENCSNTENNIDKYMYRIIGITDEGQLYLLKETFLKEGETTGFAWNEQFLLPNCLGDKCEWPNVDLYKRLNGNGVTINKSNIFVDSSQYEYMAKNNNWYNLIEDHDWMYGDTNEYKEKLYNGDEMYAIETGKVATKRFWPDEKTQTTCNEDSQCTEKDYTWSKSVKATKIGLMYMHDVLYAYTGGNPGSSTNVKNSWIHYRKDGYNFATSNEWLITRKGEETWTDAFVRGRIVDDNGNIGTKASLYGECGVRPVFYLSPKAKIASGDGTNKNPFIINL